MANRRRRNHRSSPEGIPAASFLAGAVLVLLILGLTFGPTTGSLQGQAPAAPQDKLPPGAPGGGPPQGGQVPAPTPGSPPPSQPPAPTPAPAPPMEQQPQPAQPVPTTVSSSGAGAAVSGFSTPSVQPMSGPVPAVERHRFHISPMARARDLLPRVPRIKKPAGPLMTDDLSAVPEVEMTAAEDKSDPNKATHNIAHMMAKIHHLNTKKTDGFLLALRRERSDLDGMPFAMGDACRTKGERSEQFKREVEMVRQVQQGGAQPMPNGPGPMMGMGSMPGGMQAARQAPANAKAFWSSYETACSARDAEVSSVDHGCRDNVLRARVAALMQIMMPESAEMRQGLVKYLSTVSHVEATRALARLALFSSEKEIRQAALDTLKVRRERDYTDVIERGLRYPLPAVARRAAEAVVQLERKDLIPRLVAVLEDADPRAPVMEEIDGKKVPVVRELVRVNHHRNCLMCHSPASPEGVAPTTLTAGVPIPGQPLNPPSQGYGQSIPEVLVRLDVTYLRQDFSVMQPVADAHPWPEMQRFDYLVRTRTLDSKEADLYRTKLEPREKGRLSPYHSAALVALRDLTGRDTEPSAAAWRRLLDLPSQRQ